MMSLAKKLLLAAQLALLVTLGSANAGAEPTQPDAWCKPIEGAAATDRQCGELVAGKKAATIGVKGCKTPGKAQGDVETEPPRPLTCSNGVAVGDDATFTCSGFDGATAKKARFKFECNRIELTVSVPLKAQDGGQLRATQEEDVTDPDPKAEALPRLSDVAWRTALREVGLPLAGNKVGNYYNRVEDLAVLFFDADGDGYFPIPDVIDEDDDVYVVVVDTLTRIKGLSLRTEGCKRPPAEDRVFGVPAAGAKATGKKQPAYFAIRALGKCAGAASGGPKLRFTRNGVSRTQVIPINELYRLAVGVAAAYDNTRQRDFALNTLPGEGVPRVAQIHDHIGLTSLTYISLYPIARDFRKKDFFLAQRAQLFLGLDPRAFDKHLVAGVGYEITAGLNVLLGWRLITKQKVLEEGSGLGQGVPFDGKPSTLPTRERWEFGGWFVGAGLSSSLLARLK